MKRIIIKGNKKLTGTLKIGGAKNSAVAIIPAAILSDEIVTINNVPNISDKFALIEILELLNAKVDSKDQTLVIDSSKVENCEIRYDLCKKLRASYYLMGILLSKFKKVEIYVPGGCKIGERPIDFHLKGFEALGAKITVDDEKYTIEADKLVGTDINLSFASVGATVNIMFAAVKAEGKTTITNAAKEVEIINIADLLISMGAKITGAGTSVITIEGVEKLGAGEISILSDRIEAGTYLVLGALLGENYSVEGVEPQYLEALFDKLDQMNIKYTIEGNKVHINKAEDIKPISCTTGVYPEFVTDLGQPFQVLLTQANGKSHFKETIYENRMGHIKYLNRMGAKITAEQTEAYFEGKTDLTGAEITAVDLRGGAALVLAGLIAEGTTIIKDADHVLRGYENIINKLSDLGANIEIDEI